MRGLEPECLNARLRRRVVDAVVTLDGALCLDEARRAGREEERIQRSVRPLKHEIDAIAHFAAKIVVPESVGDPLGYYLNNVSKARNLIECAVTMTSGLQ